MDKGTVIHCVHDCAQMTGEYVQGLTVALKSLITQAKINKYQTHLNRTFIFAAIGATACLFLQNRKINRLGKQIDILKQAEGE